MITDTTVFGSSGGRIGGPMQWISDQRRTVPNGRAASATSWSAFAVWILRRSQSEDASYVGIRADPSADGAVDVGSSHSRIT